MVVSRDAVLTIPAETTLIVPSLTNGALNLTWPASQTGFRVQSQTNPPGAGLTTNWQTVANSNTTNQLTIPVDASNGSVFFRLVYP